MPEETQRGRTWSRSWRDNHIVLFSVILTTKGRQEEEYLANAEKHKLFTLICLSFVQKPSLHDKKF